MSDKLYDVFLSYAHSDKDVQFSRSLTHELRHRGMRVWFDEGNIRIGDSILKSISEALEQSRYFLVVVSPDYLSNPWTSFELGVALGRRSGAEDPKVLPLFLRNLDQSSLPPLLAHTRGLNVQNEPIEAIANEVEKVIRDRQDDDANQTA